MNFQLRTNETLKIGQLMNRALNSFGSGDEKKMNPGTLSHDLEVEGGGPVRPAVRVPYSSSHYLSAGILTTADLNDQHYDGGDSDRAGNADHSTEVVAA